MTRLVGDLAITAIALAIGLAVGIALPIDVPGTGLHTLGDMGSAAFFPLLAIIVICLSAIGLGLTTYVNREREASAIIPPIGARPWLMTLAFVVFIPLIHTLGMVTASALMILVLPYVYGFRDNRWIVPIAIILPVAVYFLFERVLKVLFPHGIIF